MGETMKPYAKQFYKSKQWRQCREAYIQYRGGLCETCQLKGKITPGKIVHHKIYLTPNNINDPNISLNWENLRLDCQDCHNKEHHEKYSVTRDDVMFNDYGELVPNRDTEAPP